MVVYCGRCESGYTSQDNFEKHYDRPHIRRKGAGGYVTNPCYKQDFKLVPKICNPNLAEAKSLYKSAVNNPFFKHVPKEQAQASATAQPQSKPMDVDNDNIDIGNNETVTTASGVMQHHRTDENNTGTKRKRNLESDSDLNGLESLDSDNVQTVLSKLENLKLSQEANHAQEMIKIQQILDKVGKLENQSSAASASKPAKNQCTPTADDSDTSNSLAAALLQVKHSKSISEILQISIIKGDFQLNESKDSLICMCCSETSRRNNETRSTQFKVENCDYSQHETPGNLPMWFKNLKRSILRHLDYITHHENSAACKLLESKLRCSKQHVYTLCSYLIYYTLTTNSS